MRVNSAIATVAASLLVSVYVDTIAAPMSAPTWRIRTASDMTQPANRRVWVEGTCPLGACVDGKFRLKGGCGSTVTNSQKGFVFYGPTIDTALVKGERLMTAAHLQPNYIALATGVAPTADAWYVSVYPDGYMIWPENLSNEVKRSACQFTVVNTDTGGTTPLSIILN